MSALAASLVMIVLLSTVLSRSAAHWTTALIALSVAPAMVLGDWGAYYFQGIGDHARYGLTRMLPPCICMGLTVSQAVHGLTLDGALLAYAVGYWSVGLWCAVNAWRYLSGGGRGRGVAAPMSLVGYSLRAHPGTLAAITSYRLDMLLLTIIVPLSAVGNYSLATSFATPIALVGSSLGAFYFRRLGEGSRDEPAIISAAWRRFVLPTAALSTLAAASAFLVPHVLGHDFDAAVAPMVVLAFGASGLGALQLGTNILQAQGAPGLASLLFVAAAALSGVTLLLLVPRFGITGAALSSALTYLAVGSSSAGMTLWRKKGVQFQGADCA